jgi:HupE / UreJ protein
MPAGEAPFRRTQCILACASVLLLAPLVHTANRPIPEVVNVKAFVRTDAGQLELLVRVPLAAVRDVQFPTRGDADTLDLDALKSMLPGAARYWIASGFQVSDRGMVLTGPQVTDTRISISADQSFDSYQGALARLQSPDLPPGEDVFWQQVWFDIRFLYALPPDEPHIWIVPALSGYGVRVSTNLTYVQSDGGVRAFSFEGDPGVIYLDPYWTDAARHFLARGARVVLSGADFLLLLFCLALPFRQFRHLGPTIATFTGGLMLALGLGLSGVAPDAPWFQPLVEMLAAASILLAAFANIIGRVTPRRRALFALGAGSVFGFLCAAYLGAGLQFAGAQVAVAEVAFGAGTALTIAGVMALLAAACSFLFSLARVEYLERIIVSALAADTAWGWFGERWARFRKVPFQLTFDSTLLAPALGSLAVLVLVGGVVWFVNEWLKSHRFADEEVTRPQHSGSAV